MIKKVLFVFLYFFGVVWCFKIADINKDQSVLHQYEMNREIRGEDISIKAVDALFLSQKEFLMYFNMEDNIFEEYETLNGKLICICLEITNISNRKIEWDQVMESTGYGFETRTWASTNMSPIGQNINIFQTDSLNVGQTQAVWYATMVNPTCFKRGTWSQLKVNDFYYVLSLAPEKLRIQME